MWTPGVAKFPEVSEAPESAKASTASDSVRAHRAAKSREVTDAPWAAKFMKPSEDREPLSLCDFRDAPVFGNTPAFGNAESYEGAFSYRSAEYHKVPARIF